MTFPSFLSPHYYSISHHYHYLRRETEEGELTSFNGQETGLNFLDPCGLTECLLLPILDNSIMSLLQGLFIKTVHLLQDS